MIGDIKFGVYNLKFEGDEKLVDKLLNKPDKCVRNDKKISG